MTTDAERQKRARERRAQQGLQEVRGLYLPQELHQRLKEFARTLRELPPNTNKETRK